MELAQEPSEQLDMARAINLLMGTKDLYTSREISNIHRKTARVASQKPLNLKLLPPINKLKSWDQTFLFFPFQLIQPASQDNSVLIFTTLSEKTFIYVFSYV